jgi:hypothetical protein
MTGLRGPKNWEPTDDERKRIRMYAGLGITQEQIGTLIGKSVDTLRTYCKQDLDAGAAEAKAKVGGAIVKAALGGNMTAAIFYAKTQMGWKETVVNEHTGKDGEAIALRVKTDADEVTRRIVGIATASADASGNSTDEPGDVGAA